MKSCVLFFILVQKSTVLYKRIVAAMVILSQLSPLEFANFWPKNLSKYATPKKGYFADLVAIIPKYPTFLIVYFCIH